LIATSTSTDGALVGLVDNENGETLVACRRTRAISPALHRALKARDKGRRFPGSPLTRFTEAHRVVHFADGSETKLFNLITVCHFHHQALHEGRFGFDRTDEGLFVFSGADGGP
jgi:hypothetical protein